MTDRTRTLTSLSIALLLVSLPALTVFGLGAAAAKTDPPQLIKLTNGKTDSFLLADSRFLAGYGTVQGPSKGALAAWSTFSNGTTKDGYASLCAGCSAPTAKDVSGPPNWTPAVWCGIPASTGCPGLDDGYIRGFVNSAYPYLNTSLGVFDTNFGTSQLIPLHSPATPANKCLTANLTTAIYCNFLFPYLLASGGGAVGAAPFPHVLQSGYPPAYSNEVVRAYGAAWTQVTPNDYQIVQTPCLDQAGNNITFFFDPTVLQVAPNSGDPFAGFMGGPEGHVAYFMSSYQLDTPAGGCSLRQHETVGHIFIDGKSVYAFAPRVGNASFGLQSCSVSSPGNGIGCFGGFISYTGNLLVFRTYLGSDTPANSSFWLLDNSNGNAVYQIPNPGNFGEYIRASITDGGRLLWVSPDTSNPSNSVVWVYDPGRTFINSNGTLFHNLYPLGSFPGAQAFGIDGNTVLWDFTNSTSTYLQAYELYDQATGKGRLLPAVNIGGPPLLIGAYATVGATLPILYDNGLAAWISASGNTTDPLAINVYNVNAAEAGQPSLSGLRLGAYGFAYATSVVFSSLSQGWFFVNGKTTSDQVAQVYTLNVSGLPATSTSSTTSTSSSTSGSTTQSSSSSIQSHSQSSSSLTSQSSTVLTATGGGGDLIPGVPNLDLGIAVLLALVAIGALLYYLFRGGSRPGGPPVPPVIPPGGGEVTPSDKAKTQKKDCSKERLAFDSALARYKEQMAFLETADEAKWAGRLDDARRLRIYRDVRNAWHDLEQAREDLVRCLNLQESGSKETISMPPPPPDEVLKGLSMGPSPDD
ncbi:MAG: hypothetical protein OK438_01025 [Thaumarchaeota archaeon]|nr:hypothetical protein [Nitrososphaerota archaeon]